jgi:hypothetical protein
MVWHVNRFDFRNATLDFRSSGQGTYKATQLFFDDELFANATGLTDWDAAMFQVRVCEHCGIERCEPGGWVCVRALGSARLFAPCVFEDMEDYFPPAILKRKGPALLAADLYRELRARLVALPETPERLSAREFVELVRRDAPGAVFHHSDPAFDIEASRLVAVSEGPLDTMLQHVETLARAALTLSGPADVREMRPSDRPVTFHVDDAGHTEWTPLVRHADGAIALSFGGYALG